MFNIRLRKLRNENRLTQQELADKLDVTQRTIAFYEKGDRHPDYNLLIRIADILGCSVDYLLGRTNKFDEVIKKPTKEEALSVLSDGTSVDSTKVLEYIEFLKGKKND